MYQFLETIKIKDKNFCNIQLHNKRMAEVQRLFYGKSKSLQIENLVSLTNIPDQGIFKCRILYSENIEEIEIIPYTLPLIQSLKITIANEIEYAYKFSDRKILNELRNSAGMDQDILIVKNNFVTDISFANIVFYDGLRWITPSTPLLKGTKREYYLLNKQIFEEKIALNDIHKFKKARIINAMVDLDDCVEINIDRILF